MLATRAEPLGIEIVAADLRDGLPDGEFFGVIAQLPGASGAVSDWASLVEAAHERGALVALGADLLALTLITPPGEIGADVAFGSAQRFGVPMGFAVLDAGYLAVHSKHARQLPGRLVGVSVDADGSPAFRLSLQTREQHIRRDKATSNICTAQVLLAVLAAMYASYHGADGLTAIARRVHGHARALAAGLTAANVEVVHLSFFDTVLARVPGRAAAVRDAAKAKGINVWVVDDDHVSVSCDEATTDVHVGHVLDAFKAAPVEAEFDGPDIATRTSEFLATHPAFTRYRTETEMNVLPADAGRQGHRVGPQHDSARLVHDETQRRRRDGAHHVARVRASAPIRARDRHPRPAPPDLRPRGVAGRHDRLRRGVAAAQRRLAGRIRWVAGHPRVPRRPWRAAPRRVPDPVQRARHQRRVLLWPACGWSWSRAGRTATSTSRTCAQRSLSMRKTLQH